MRCERSLLARRVVDEPILPLTALAVIADRRVERSVATEAAIHVDHILFRHAKPFGDNLYLVGPQLTFLERGNPALRLAQVEEELLLVRRGAHLHQRPGTKDVLLYRRFDPPHRVRGKTEALFGLKAF